VRLGCTIKFSLLCKKIKIEVSDRDAEALEFMQDKCRGLYNWWVMKLRNGERWNLERAKKSLRESKAYDPDLHFVYGKLLAEVYFRWTKPCKRSFNAYLKERRNQDSPASSPGTSSLRCAIPPCIWKCRGRLSRFRQEEAIAGDPNAIPTLSPTSPRSLLSTFGR
jgi:hypothetical protein